MWVQFLPISCNSKSTMYYQQKSGLLDFIMVIESNRMFVDFST